MWLGLASTLVLLAMPAKGEKVQPKGFPGLGKPRILCFVNEDWKQGYWTSLGFTQDSKSLIGTNVRNPGSGMLFLLGQRIGEVRSFDLTAENKAPKIITSARNRQFEILKAPSGACQKPLLLAHWHHVRPKEVVVSQFDNNIFKESVVRQFQVPRADKITFHTHNWICVAFTPAPQTLIMGTGCADFEKGKCAEWARSMTYWGDLKGWDLQTGKPRLADIWEGNQVLAVASSADGKLIAAGGGHTTTRFFHGNRFHGRVVCLDANFQKQFFDLSLPDHQVRCLAFAPDRKTLVTGGSDGVVRWIDLLQGTVVKSLNVVSHSKKNLGGVETLAFSSKGQLLAATVGYWSVGASWGETFLVDVLKGQVYKVPSSYEDGVVTCVAFSPDGKYLAAGGIKGTLKLWQIDR